jgi:RloB-like protein
MPDQQRGRPPRSRRPYAGFSHRTNLSRPVAVRDQRWTVLILCNGERTEIDYFNGIRSAGLASPGKVMIVKFRNGSPTDTVRSASELRDYSEYDEAWAVCDVDTFDVKPAIELSTTAGINLALSQPCFEVWLILHKSDNCPGFNNADQACRALRRRLPGWDKSNLRFADFVEDILTAVERAQRLGEPPEANPSTAVWKLIVSLGVGQDVGEDSVLTPKETP